MSQLYTGSQRRRVKFLPDLKEHAGFHMEEGERNLRSPWRDDSVVKE